MERTDALANQLGISLRALAPAMKLSVASLFGYRNGSIPISGKAWGKLEQAEAKAGLGSAQKENEPPVTMLREEEPAALPLLPPSLAIRLNSMEERMSRMEEILEEIQERLPPRPKTSYRDHGEKFG